MRFSHVLSHSLSLIAVAVAIDVLVQHIRLKMEERGRRDLREELSQGIQVEEDVMPPQVHVMSETNVTRTIHTEMRDKNTERATFRFQATRLTRLLVEHALDLIPFEKLSVTTPVDDAKYHGLSHCTEVRLQSETGCAMESTDSLIEMPCMSLLRC